MKPRSSRITCMIIILLNLWKDVICNNERRLGWWMPLIYLKGRHIRLQYSPLLLDTENNNTRTIIILRDNSYCIAGNRTWLYRLPQSKIVMYRLLFRRTATVWKTKKFLAVCRVWAWWPLPRITGLSWLFNPRFPGLKIRYRYAVTWTRLLSRLVLIHQQPHHHRHHPPVQLQHWSLEYFDPAVPVKQGYHHHLCKSINIIHQTAPTLF